jgi:Zn-dependent protease with chaperone function
MIVLHLLATFVAACVAAWSINWLALIPWRRLQESHWTERARALYPARKAAFTNLLLIPANLVMAHQLILGDDAPHWTLVAPVSWLGAVIGSFGFDREVFPQIDPRTWLHEAAAGSLLRLSGLVLVAAGLALMPAEAGWQMILVTMLYLAAQLTLTCRFVSVLKWLRLVEPASPRLLEIVRRVADRMNVPVKKVWLLRGASANAFALPIVGELLFSKRLADLMADDELAAICAHELGHFTESRFSLLIRILSSLMFMPWLFLTPLVHAYSVVGMIIPALAMLLWLYLFKTISRRLEVRADAIARAQEEDTGVYARALEKIHEANRIPAVFPAREQTHPHLYDRLLAAGVTPAYARPKPPPSTTWAGQILSILLGVLVVLSVMATRSN